MISLLWVNMYSRCCSTCVFTGSEAGYPDHGRVADLVRLFEKGSPVGSDEDSPSGGCSDGELGRERLASGALLPKPIFAATPSHMTYFADSSGGCGKAKEGSGVYTSGDISSNDTCSRVASHPTCHEPTTQSLLPPRSSLNAEGIPHRPSRFSMDEDPRRASKPSSSSSRFSLDEDPRHAVSPTVNNSRLYRSSAAAPLPEGWTSASSALPPAAAHGPPAGLAAPNVSPAAPCVEGMTNDGPMSALHASLQKPALHQRDDDKKQSSITGRRALQRWFSGSLDGNGGGIVAGRRSLAGNGKVVPVMANGSPCSSRDGSAIARIDPSCESYSPSHGASHRFLHLFGDEEAVKLSQSLSATSPRAPGHGLEDRSLNPLFSPLASRKWGSFSGTFGQQSVHPRGHHQMQRPWNGSMDGSSALAVAPRSVFGSAASIGGGSGAASPLRLTLSPRGSFSGGDRASFGSKVHPDASLMLVADNPIYQNLS